MMNVYVTNKSDKALTVSYCFKNYSFPVGETVEVEEGLARHIFGYGDDNKEPYMVSLGLITTKNDIPKGLEALAKFEITLETPKKNHVTSPVIELVPPPVVKKRGEGKVAAA